jgi:hypothetical protein
MAFAAMNPPKTVDAEKFSGYKKQKCAKQSGKG